MYRYWFDSLVNTSANEPERLDGASVAKFLLKSGLDPLLLKKVRLGIGLCMYACMYVCVCSYVCMYVSMYACVYVPMCACASGRGLIGRMICIIC